MPTKNPEIAYDDMATGLKGADPVTALRNVDEKDKESAFDVFVGEVEDTMAATEAALDSFENARMTASTPSAIKDFEAELCSDPVQHPSHYGGKDDPFEAIKVMEATLTPAEIVGAYKFEVYTYMRRANKKNGLQDYKKAQFYMNRLVAFMESDRYKAAKLSL